MSINWWKKIRSPELRQGDLLEKCMLPKVPQKWKPSPGLSSAIDVVEYRVIVVTQSCDLEQSKAPFVAACPISTLDEFSAVTSHFSQQKNWEPVRRGQNHALHLLSPLDNASTNKLCFVVDFRQIFSMPFEYMAEHAKQVGDRYRLQSPYLEHMAQAFARFFMRVGLPSDIPPFS